MQQREDNEAESEKKESVEKEEQQNKQIRDMGQVILNENSNKYKVELLTIIGEVEGHESAPSHSKTTKYEHVLPKLAMIEDDKSVDGLLVLLNTVGGDVEAGLAIAEMIASLSVPTVSLVLGGGHSIGVPMAVSADYSFVVPSATMVIHPVRTNGMFIGVAQSYRNMEKIQDRITTFISSHTHMSQERLEELMLDPTQLVKDVGTMLEGIDAVKYDVILCPHCGYAALNRYFNSLNKVYIKQIKENISSKVQLHTYDDDIYSYEEAIERYKLCLANAVVKRAHASEKAYICLKSGWLMRGYQEHLEESGDTDMARLREVKTMEEAYLKNAYTGFTEALQTEGFPMCGMDEITVEFLIAVLAARFQKYDVASRMVATILTSPSANARTKDKARELKDQILEELKNQKK